MRFALGRRSLWRLFCITMTYKGTASYWSVTADGRKLTDAVWSYPQAEGDSAAVRGYLCFRHDELTVEVGPPPA